MHTMKNRIEHNVGSTRAKRSTQYFLIALAISVMVLSAIVFTLSDMGPPKQSPTAARALGLPDRSLPPCAGLTGRELERCHVLKQVRPGEYAKTQDRNIDASSNSARTARGSGVEGASSAGNTLEPQN